MLASPPLPDTSTPQNTGTSHLTLAIIDDHPPIRQAIRHTAEDRMGMEVVAEADSNEDALRLITEHTPTVAVIDLSLSDGLSFGLMRTLRAECPGTALLVFSMYEEKIYAERALRHGASGYLMKPASTADLLAAAEKVGRGEVYLSPEMTTRVLRGQQAGTSQQIHFPIDELTDRQLEIFRLIGEGLTAKMIADRLEITQKTVEAHRRNAKNKLGYDSIDQVTSHAARWVQAEKCGDAV